MKRVSCLHYERTSNQRRNFHMYKTNPPSLVISSILCEFDMIFRVILWMVERLSASNDGIRLLTCYCFTNSKVKDCSCLLSRSRNFVLLLDTQLMSMTVEEGNGHELQPTHFVRHVWNYRHFNIMSQFKSNFKKRPLRSAKILCSMCTFSKRAQIKL